MFTVSHNPPNGFSTAEKLSLFASFVEDLVPFHSPDKNHESQLDTVVAILKEVYANFAADFETLWTASASARVIACQQQTSINEQF